MATFDLQLHSSHSPDSFLSVDRLLRTARERDLDGVAITDHDSFAGSRAALDRNPDDLLVVPGMEVGTEYGDVLALGLEEPVESRRFRGVADEVARQDGVLVLAHPFRKQTEYPDSVLDRVDAVEGLNARSRPSTNARARGLGTDSQLPTTGSSDAHLWFEVGAGRTTTDRTITDIDDLTAAIRDGAVDHAGQESPYYLTHGLSVGIEQLKRVFDPV